MGSEGSTVLGPLKCAKIVVKSVNVTVLNSFETMLLIYLLVSGSLLVTTSATYAMGSILLFWDHE